MISLSTSLNVMQYLYKLAGQDAKALCTWFWKCHAQSRSNQEQRTGLSWQLMDHLYTMSWNTNVYGQTLPPLPDQRSTIWQQRVGISGIMTSCLWWYPGDTGQHCLAHPMHKHTRPLSPALHLSSPILAIGMFWSYRARGLPILLSFGVSCQLHITPTPRSYIFFKWKDF